MRRVTIGLTLLLFVVSAAALAADAPVTNDAAAHKPKLTFDGQTLILGWQGKNEQAGEFTREFIPADQTLDHWTSLASIREYPDLNDPRSLAEILARTVKERLPDSLTSISDKSDSDETVVDFVLWADDKSFAEFNVFKYRKNPAGGILAEQFAVRDYADPAAFVKNLKPLRDRLVKLMTTEGLQLEQ